MRRLLRRALERLAYPRRTIEPEPPAVDPPPTEAARTMRKPAWPTYRDIDDDDGETD